MARQGTALGQVLAPAVPYMRAKFPGSPELVSLVVVPTCPRPVGDLHDRQSLRIGASERAARCSRSETPNAWRCRATTGRLTNARNRSAEGRYGFVITDRFDEDVVSPVVAEVVDMEEALNATLDERFPADAGGPVHEPVPEVVIGQGLAVDALANNELEQIGTCPADCNLDDVVQGHQRRAERHVDPAREPRFNLAQFAPEPYDGFRSSQESAVRHRVVYKSGGEEMPRRHRRSGRNRRATARRRRVPARRVTPTPLTRGPWPPGGMPSTCASLGDRPALLLAHGALRPAGRLGRLGRLLPAAPAGCCRSSKSEGV